ncbi:MAG TPA: nucleoside hydrolase [Gemmatimonadales bacterium]|nr:nucleoside hydrolase [Gemmatimonadales bacterium]
MPDPSLPSTRTPLPVVIDTDPGIDDTLALLLALRSPELDVRGIAVTYGNTTVEQAFRNCVEILRRVGRRLTLAVSARRPLKRALAVALETHGATGLGDAQVPPAGVILDFVKPLDRLLADQVEPVTLVTLGPVTGLALALRRDASLVRRTVKRHIAMIGNLRAAGNTTRYSEFNAWCDPEALAEVLRAELPTELVGLDVTRKLLLAGHEIDRLGRSDDQLERWLHAALRFYLDFHRQQEKLDGCVINDVLPIAELLAPGTLSFEPLRVVVDLEDGEPRGRTRVDPNGARVRMATGVQPETAYRLLVDRVLGTLAPARAGR